MPIKGSSLPAYLFFLGVKLSVDIHPVVDIALRTIAKFFVFLQDLMVKGVNFSELLVRRIFVSINLVLDLARRGCDWDHSLDIKHVIPMILLAAVWKP